MDVRAVDRIATSGSSALHRTSPAGKLVAFASVLVAVVVQNNAFVVLAVLITIAAVAAAAALPPRLVFGLAAYPGLFALVFAFAAAPDVLTGALFVLKAMTAALAAVTLACTTPYPHIFAPVQRIVPEVVGDALLMTYRSFFILADKLDRLGTAVRIRAGLATRSPTRAVRAGAAALGGLVLYAFDLSQREYDVMRLRGYEGRLRTTLPRSAAPAAETALIAGALAVLAGATVFRLAAGALNPYSWLTPVSASAVLLAVVIWRSIRR